MTVRIKGGKTLHGEVPIVSNKNAILPALAASILTKDWMKYQYVPKSPDVIKLLNTLEHMGAIVRWNETSVSISCGSITTSKVPSEYIDGMQAGYLLAGPLLARFGEAIIPRAFGCRLGYRGPEDHLEYFSKLGVEYTLYETEVHFKLSKSIKENRPVISKQEPLFTLRQITYSSACVTPTENILMLLAATSGYETEISGIAQEPHVAQLIELLQKMGATINGKGSTISVIGSEKLKGINFIPEPDHVDYFGFAVTAAMTRSDLLFKMPTPLAPGIVHMNEFLERVGVQFKVELEGVRVYGSKSSFKPAATFPKADKDTYKINPGPWPMSPVDCLPSNIAWSTMNPDPVTATQAQNWSYTDGLKYVPVLKEMGARISSYDDQRVTVHGISGGNPYQLKATVTAPDVIEGARAVISCALAGGEYTIQNAQYILRRNPEFFNILKNSGADIEIENLEQSVEEVVM